MVSGRFTNVTVSTTKCVAVENFTTPPSQLLWMKGFAKVYDPQTMSDEFIVTVTSALINNDETNLAAQWTKGRASHKEDAASLINKCRKKDRLDNKLLQTFFPYLL